MCSVHCHGEHTEPARNLQSAPSLDKRSRVFVFSAPPQNARFVLWQPQHAFVRIAVYNVRHLRCREDDSTNDKCKAYLATVRHCHWNRTCMLTLDIVRRPRSRFAPSR